MGLSGLILAEIGGLFQLGDFLMESMLAAGAAVLGERQLFRGLGLVAFREVVEVAADGAFQA